VPRSPGSAANRTSSAAVTTCVPVERPSEREANPPPWRFHSGKGRRFKSNGMFSVPQSSKPLLENRTQSPTPAFPGILKRHDPLSSDHQAPAQKTAPRFCSGRARAPRTRGPAHVFRICCLPRRPHRLHAARPPQIAARQWRLARPLRNRQPGRRGPPPRVPLPSSHRITRSKNLPLAAPSQ
jgi:hypothetical protein